MDGVPGPPGRAGPLGREVSITRQSRRLNLLLHVLCSRLLRLPCILHRNQPCVIIVVNCILVNTTFDIMLCFSSPRVLPEPLVLQVYLDK